MRKQTILTGAAALVLAAFLAACSGPAVETTLTAAPSPTPAAESTAPALESTPASEPPEWGEQVFTQTYTAGDGTQVMSVRYTLPCFGALAALLSGAA